MITTKDLYKIANETTEKEYNNLLETFTKKEEEKLNSLVMLGDKKELSLWTVINYRYTKNESEIYYAAYCL